MENYKNLQDTLSFFNIDCNNSYYISTGKSIFEFPNEPFRMDYYTFCICTKGEIDLKINGIECIINVGSIICSAPSTIVHFLNATNDFQMQLVFFDKIFLLTNISDPFIIERMGLFQNDSCSIVNTSEKNIKNLLNIVDKLKSEEKSTSDFMIPKIRTLIFLLLIEIAEIYLKLAPKTIADKDPQTHLFFRFNKLIQENILAHKKVTFYANQLCISNKYLIEITKKTTGRTPHHIIDQALLKEAYVLLGNPRYNITQIADLLQFSSVSAFGRFFKKYACISPTEYQEMQGIS
ncbi:helix-turn-helix domain-containing protein [Flavobacterium sp. Arc2]|uniref:helix-turn-helix domain-containing protein n=1 Tax=Flavobacterium sp. Arc2 TaxID=3046685 RepID=UPI00352D1182